VPQAGERFVQPLVRFFVHARPHRFGDGKRESLFVEWNNKAAGFVSYGSAGAARAVEHLSLVMAELMVASVRDQVMLFLFTDFEKFSRFSPHPRHEDELNTMLDQVVDAAATDTGYRILETS
jgi:NAD(P)H-dependent FMN reductase